MLMWNAFVGGILGGVAFHFSLILYGKLKKRVDNSKEKKRLERQKERLRKRTLKENPFD
jgi:NAD/NADP transhydrogenase beta subunit